ncbi:MAG TPA: galactokinase family protein [Gemmatimonadales bacterium]|nr:galactokinase family protein [Gemmatimonadales bacterium]
MPPTSPLRLASSLFEASFASRPAAGASAPGRVNLLGEHTDYNGGPVLPFALPQRTVVLAGPGEGWQAVSGVDSAVVSFDPTAAPEGRWTDYLAGVIRVLDGMRAAPPGGRIAVASTVPAGAGLSSSAALSVAAARAVSHLAGRRLSREALVEVAFHAEHDVVGVQCGRMDQMIVVHAAARHAALIETAEGSVTPIPFDQPVLVFETGVAHRLADGEYNRRRGECRAALAACRVAGVEAVDLAGVPESELERLRAAMPAVLHRRLTHVVRESARTRAAAMALSVRDYPKFGEYLVEGHRSIRDDFESSCGEADRLVESAMRHGAWGARLTGAGWGGAVLVMAPPDRLASLTSGVSADFRREVGRGPTVWTARASGGVRGERAG